MKEIEAIIVAVTHMREGRCCIGALQVQRDTDGQLMPVRNWRLLRFDGAFPMLTDTEFRVGEIWRLILIPLPVQKLKPPHLEDAYVFRTERIGHLDEPLAMNLYQILQRNPHIPFVRGSVSQLFEGKLHRDSNLHQDSQLDSWSHYILPEDAPMHSTSFWIPNFNLRVEEHFNKLRVFSREVQLGMRYVAIEPYVQAGDVIPTGSLLRVSLARPWTPDENTPPRCYMMLSQYYGMPALL